MKRLGLWVVAGLLVTALLAIGAAAWLLPSRQPRVEQAGAAVEVADVERALRLVRQHDPRRALPGVVRTLALTQHEAEVLLNQAAARIGGGRWRVEIGTEQLRVLGSIPLPPTPLGTWLDIEVLAEATQGLPRLRSARAGRLPLPTSWLEGLLHAWADRHDLAGEAPVVAVHRVTLQPGRLQALYAWGPDAPVRLVAVLLPQRERERMRVYAQRLAELAADGPGAAGQPRSVSEVLPPLFELARRRSRDSRSAALENRAALLVLGMAANGAGLGLLLPEWRDRLAARPIQLTLAGRRDFPQHLLLSAALAADSGIGLADTLGLYKELADARWGSGFSFNDIAANRAGTRLGELAISAPERMQARLSRLAAEAELMPDVSDLPEFLSEREFRARFGAPGTPAYQQMMGDIEQRLGATPVFRP